MNFRTLFLVELLEKLSSPLLQAAFRFGDDDVVQARAVASMVGSSVQLGMALGDMVGVNDTAGNEDEADSLRVALTALSAPLIAEYQKTHNRIPNDEDVKKITKALESVITLSQNFSPASGHAARLKMMDGSKPLFDPVQTQIFYMSAMTPVLGAVAEFSFGRTDAQLLQEIAGKLETRAETLRTDLMGSGADEAEVKFFELMILQSFARLYAECHRAETNRLLSAEIAPDSQAVAPSLDPVWAAFDVRMSMMEALLNISAPPVQNTSAAPELVAAPVSPPATSGGSPLGMFAKKPENPAPPLAPNVDAPPVTSAPAAAPPPASGGSPMSFFKKKPAEGNTGE